VTQSVSPVQRPDDSRVADASVHVRVSGLSKKFGSFTALHDASFSINRGELICLLGPSGCGKTTLLRAIAGLDKQTSGRIEIAGRDVSHLPPAKRNFGMVFQSYALFPNLTVADNIGYGLIARRFQRAVIRDRVKELLSLVHLVDAEAKYPAQLSGGQQQRVALARALATSPDLLLLDEPLSALDAQVRVYLRDEIKTLQKRLGLTTILVTHDQDEALAIADRVVLMRAGAIEQIDTPKDIYEHPNTEFAMRFVGISNFLSVVKVGQNQVRIGTTVLDAAVQLPGPAGGSLLACFRPEDLRLGEGEPNAIGATVHSVTFRGSHWNVVARLCGDPAQSLQADVSPDLFRRSPLSEGNEVTFSVAPDRIRVFASKP
jgi:iron(III) transport system ATP-binding protein